MSTNAKYLLATFTDGTLFKIPAAVIINKLQKDIADQNGITVGMVALKMQEEGIHDHQIIAYARGLDYHSLMADAIKLTRKPGLHFKEGWPSSLKEVKTQQEIDNMKLEQEVSHG